MKLASLLSIFFFAFFSVSAQNAIVGKLWVGDSGNYFKIDTDAVRVECHYEFHGKKNVSTQAYRYSLIGDTFRIMENFKGGLDRDFIIKTASADNLVLMAVTNPLPLLFSDKPKQILSFRSQQKIYTDTIVFQKIVFSSTTCYGTCPSMSLQIDNSKHMDFKGGKFAVKQGFYSSTLSNQYYSELLKLLAISDLDKLENQGRFNIDLPTYQLEIHYNNKVKFIKSSFMPRVIYQLTAYLLEIPKKVELKEAEQKEILFSQ